MPTDTFYPNADGRVQSDDGTSWANCRAGTGTLSASSSESVERVGESSGGGGPTFQAREVFFEFDTSSIPDGATITAVTFKIKGNGTRDWDQKPLLELRAFDWGGGVVSTADWVPGADLSGYTLLATYDTNTWFGFASYYDFTESGSSFRSHINKTGMTRFVMATDMLRDNTAPTDNRYGDIYMVERAGTGDDPILEVTYTTNQAPNAPTLDSPADAATIYADAANVFQFDATDPDGGDSMSSYALKFTLDGVTRWWRVSDDTWQSGETFNSSSQGFPVSNKQVTIGANEFNDYDNDGTGTWSVSVKDAAGVQSAYSSTRSITVEPAAPRTGPITQTLPSLTQDAEGALESSGPIAQALPSLTQDMTAESIGGPIAQTLPSLTQDANATHYGGGVTSVLPSLQQDMAGNSIGGPISSVLPSLETSIIGPSIVGTPAAPFDRHIAFRYELLDAENVHLGWLDEVLGGSVENNALADIKRTATFRIKDTDDINWLSDRIKPWVDLNGESWPMGVFLLSSPARTSEGPVVTRDVEAYDQLVVLQDDKVTDRYTIAAGVNYIAAVRTLLEGAGIGELNLTATSKTLPVARDWEPGTTKLHIVNELLGAINYRSLYFDAHGVAVAEPYLSPAVAAPKHIYANDDLSVIFPGVDEMLDLFGVPNKWVLVVSEPDRTPLTAEYINDNASSPTSTVSRGRTIVDFRTDDAADQTALNEKVARLAFEASQVYAIVEMSTALMPSHGEADVVELVYSHLDISARFSEHRWATELRPGAQMQHTLRRVVQV